MTAVEGDTVLQSEVLEDLAEAVNYRHWLVDLAVPFLIGPTLEVGSGIGLYAAHWADRGVAITASEADQQRLEKLRTRFAGDPRVKVRELSVPIATRADYAAVVAYNVLEHIPDDVGALRAFGGLLAEGGAVVLVVPALPALMSRFDRSIGHQRRYRRIELAAVLAEAGLEVEVLRHVNLPGVPAWFVGMRLLGMSPRAGAMLRAWDRLVVPVARRLERRWTPPVGQSLFAVARRPAPRRPAPR
jgi:SAM-dependent methyltransferase